MSSASTGTRRDDSLIDELAGAIEEKCLVAGGDSGIPLIPSNAPENSAEPATCLIVLGMAGSGKTTFVEVTLTK